MVDEDDVIDALSNVIDPELGLDFVELGLVYGVEIDGGSVKGVAILTRERSPALPNLPTALEQGFDVQAYAWSALFLPRRTPDPIVRTLNQAVVEALDGLSSRLAWTQPDAAAWWASYRLTRNQTDSGAGDFMSSGESAETL